MKIVNVGKEGIYIHLYGDSGGWISLNIYSIKELRHKGNQPFVTIVNARNDSITLKATDIEDPDNPGSNFDWQGLWDWIIGAASPVTEIPRDGLILEYFFCGNTVDTSDSANDGLMHGTDVQLAVDRFGADQAAYESATGSQDNEIVTSNPVQVSGNDARSISWWMRVDTSNRKQYIWMSGTPSANQALAAFTLTDNNIYFGKWNGNIRFGTTLEVTDGQWHHYVMVYDGSTFGNLKLYVDTVEFPGIINDPSSDVALNTTLSEISFFHRVGAGTDEGLIGALDDIRIYNRVLTDAEINAIFNDTPTCIGSDWVIHEGIPVIHDTEQVTHNP